MSEQDVVSDGWSADLPAFAELVASLGDIDEDAGPDVSTDVATTGSMDLEEIHLALAIELEVRDAERELPRVTGSTPTQWTETTIMPVFHRLSMRIAQVPSA